MSKRILIEPDNISESPRREWDNLTKMFCFHRRYSLLGDKHNLNSNMFSGWSGMCKHIVAEYNPIVIKPLYMLDHSGITIATTPFSCPWDSGQVGWVFVPYNAAKENWGFKRKSKRIEIACERCLDAEVAIYDQYLNGDVWCYSVYEGDECVDSLCGIYGYETVKEYVAGYIEDGFEIGGSKDG